MNSSETKLFGSNSYQVLIALAKRVHPSTDHSNDRQWTHEPSCTVHHTIHTGTHAKSRQCETIPAKTRARGVLAWRVSTFLASRCWRCNSCSFCAIFKLLQASTNSKQGLFSCTTTAAASAAAVAAAGWQLKALFVNAILHERV